MKPRVRQTEELDEDGIDQFVHEKFKKLEEMFLDRTKRMKEYVLSKKPKKPEKRPDETSEEYEKRYEGKVPR